MNPLAHFRSLPPEGAEWRGSESTCVDLDAMKAGSVPLPAQSPLGAARRRLS